MPRRRRGRRGGCKTRCHKRRGQRGGFMPSIVSRLIKDPKFREEFKKIRGRILPYKRSGQKGGSIPILTRLMRDPQFKEELKKITIKPYRPPKIR